jgi:SAM-dependent methyltransferase
MNIVGISKLRHTAEKHVPPALVALLYSLLGLKRLAKYPKFVADYRAFRRLSRGKDRPATLRWKDTLPQLNEATPTTHFDSHYTYHPAWAARILAATNPAEHVDVSSVLSFATLVSAFVPVRFYDYRPAQLQLDNLYCGQADLVHLPFKDEELSSLSCMHTVEHVGLGRYGDALDPEGDLKAMNELCRVLAPGGSLLFVVPIGQPKIHFNSHRIYSYRQVRDYFRQLSVKEFALIRDGCRGGGIVRNASEEEADCQIYGCGCFWFVK